MAVFAGVSGVAGFDPAAIVAEKVSEPGGRGIEGMLEEG
jgi:hypothetical protein